MIAWVEDNTICTCGNSYNGTTASLIDPCPVHDMVSTWVGYTYHTPEPKKEQIIPKWWHYFETFNDVLSLYMFPTIKAKQYIVRMVRKLMFHKSGYLPKRIRSIRKSK